MLAKTYPLIVLDLNTGNYWRVGSGKTTCAKALMQLVDYTAKSC